MAWLTQVWSPAPAAAYPGQAPPPLRADQTDGLELAGSAAEDGPAEGERDRRPGEEIAAVALGYLGARYQWGGASPAGFDCSGLIFHVLAQTGRAAPRDHWGQLGMGPRIDRVDLQPGDLVFFQNTYTVGLSHSGIYIGDGKFVHAGAPASGVVVSALNDPYWGPRWLGATRVA